MLLSKLPVECLDEVPPSLHLGPSQKAVSILRVSVVVGKEGSREHLHGKVYNTDIEVLNS